MLVGMRDLRHVVWAGSALRITRGQGLCCNCLLGVGEWVGDRRIEAFRSHSGNSE